MTITIDGSNLPVQSILSNRTPEVQRTQQILIFLISIALVSCIDGNNLPKMFWIFVEYSYD
jgi:hypothetical protein